jgi:hypothetical protein
MAATAAVSWVLMVCGGCGTSGTAGDDDSGDDGGDDESMLDPVADPNLRVELEPAAGVGGMTRVNFAVPSPEGFLTDAQRVVVGIADGSELPAGRRALATWPDGSIRSVQIQVEVDVSAVTALDVEVGGQPSAGSIDLVPVVDTLVAADGSAGPRVWARLPAVWLASSKVAGPLLAAGEVAPGPLDGWIELCDYASFDITEFLALATDRGSWLYDRPTALYRGYAMTGGQAALASAYRETGIYFGGITGSGSSTRISIPTAQDDVKYHYSQGLAIHYLLTGDDRFREAAENIAIRMHDLWSDPGYDPGDFWTERNAGFSLLAYEWAAAVTDDRAGAITGFADEAAGAYLDLLDIDANAWEADARCFAHSAADHDEPYGYVGCSPWMSAILADGLDAHARRVGGAAAERARDGLVRLGRMVARHGLDGDGRPYYWMGAGVDSNEADEYDEHWGESAYIVAMAWFHDGRADADLRASAMGLVEGFSSNGEVGQLRSFNWQCRSAVATPYFLRED